MNYISNIIKIFLDLTNVSNMDMIIASHESINGHYDKLNKMFKENSYQITEEEREKYIELYCLNKIN